MNDVWWTALVAVGGWQRLPRTLVRSFVVPTHVQKCEGHLGDDSLSCGSGSADPRISE